MNYALPGPIPSIGSTGFAVPRIKRRGPVIRIILNKCRDLPFPASQKLQNNSEKTAAYQRRQQRDISGEQHGKRR
jgi:hypothetical protein